MANIQMFFIYRLRITVLHVAESQFENTTCTTICIKYKPNFPTLAIATIELCEHWSGQAEHSDKASLTHNCQLPTVCTVCYWSELQPTTLSSSNAKISLLKHRPFSLCDSTR